MVNAGIPDGHMAPSATKVTQISWLIGALTA